jgi:hypothetical protein
MGELMVREQYNQYPNIISYNKDNPTVHSPYADIDIFFYQTIETLQDIDTFRNFLKNAETRFRASKEYKAYKSYLMSMGLNRCQAMGNITEEDANIELHHNVLGLFDICLLITYHTINTVGCITTFDLIQLLIQEHYNNRVGVTFLSKTAHQVYTNDPEGFIPPEMTFGKWWELLSEYKYGITYEIANKVIKYIKKYQDHFPMSINLPQQEQILSFAEFNEFGTPLDKVGYLPGDKELDYENIMPTYGNEFPGF